MKEYNCYFQVVLILSSSIIFYSSSEAFGQSNTGNRELVITFSNQTGRGDSFLDVKLGDIISSLAATIAAIGLFLSVDQMRKNQRNFNSQMNITKIQIDQNQKQFLDQMQVNENTNNAEFWLSLREFISKYDATVHFKLMPGGEWNERDLPTLSSTKKGPSSHNEWAPVIAYMGIFEHCIRMLDRQLIDLETFKQIYGYRIRLLLENDIIRKQTIENNGENWQDFIHLCHTIGYKNMLPEPWKFLVPVESSRPKLSIQLRFFQDPIPLENKQDIRVVVLDQNTNEKISDAFVGGNIILPSSTPLIIEGDTTDEEGQIVFSFLVNQPWLIYKK